MSKTADRVDMQKYAYVYRHIFKDPKNTIQKPPKSTSVKLKTVTLMIMIIIINKYDEKSM